MKNIFKKLSVVALAIFAFASVTYAATILPVPQGGTGLSSIAPTGIIYSQNASTGPFATDVNFVRDPSTQTTLIAMPQNAGVDVAGVLIGNDLLGVPGTNGILMRRGDDAEVVGTTIMGIIDGTPLGAPSAYIGFFRADDAVTGESFQQFFFPGTGGMSASDGSDSGLMQLGIGQAQFGADNNDGGGNDSVYFAADINGGAGAQYLRGVFADGTNNYGLQVSNTGITFDFDDFNGTPGTFYTFPTADGTNGQALVTDGSGNLSFQTISGGGSIGGSISSNQIAFGTATPNEIQGTNNFIYGNGYSIVTHTTEDNSDSLTYGSASFSGSGLDDLTLTWNSSIYASNKYGGNLTITIDTTGSPDTFNWYFTGGYSQTIGSGTSVAITGGVQTLNDADGNKIAEIQFGATTGHTVSDHWNASTSLGGNPKGYLLKDNLYHEFFVSNPNGGAYKLGDDGLNGGSAWWGNGTLLEIQDNAGVMYLDVPNDLYIESPGSGGYQVGHFDMQSREVQFGDLDIVGNKTRFAISDPANTVYVTADGSQALTVYNANYDEQYFRVGTLSGGTLDFGDLSSVGNSSTFTFSDAASRAIFSLDDQFNLRSAASTSRYYFNAGYNSGNPIISFGALSYGNGTAFALNDQNQTIESFIDGVFRIKSTSAVTGFEVDTANKVAQFGWISGSGINGNYGLIDDANHDVRFVTDSSGYFSIKGGSYVLSQVNASSRLVTNGDVLNATTSTKTIIDVPNEKFTFATSGTDRFVAYKDWTLIGNAFVTANWQTYTGSGNVTMNNNVSGLVYNPASVNANATITLPTTSGGTGSNVTIVFGGTITSTNPVVTNLTIDPGSGNTIVDSSAPIAAIAGDSLTYHKEGAFWYRVR